MQVAGSGRGHALEFARQGAKVVVNDLGGEVDGSGNEHRTRAHVVDEILAMGGEAIANGDDVADWKRRGEMVDSAIERFGKLDVVVCNAGILRDRMLFNMDEAEWDAVINVHLKGTFSPSRYAAQYWRELSTRRGARWTHGSSTLPRRRACSQSRAEQLRRGEVRYRDTLDHRGEGARTLRRNRQRDRAWCAHADDREPRWADGGRRRKANGRA